MVVEAEAVTNGAMEVAEVATVEIGEIEIDMIIAIDVMMIAVEAAAEVIATIKTMAAEINVAVTTSVNGIKTTTQAAEVYVKYTARFQNNNV